MAEFFEKIKEWAGLLKFILPVLGLGTGGGTFYSRVDQILPAYGAKNHLSVNYNTATLDQDMLAQWGGEMVSRPVMELSATPMYLLGGLLVFLISAYLMFLHIQQWNNQKNKDSLYGRFYNEITLIVYIVLVSCILAPVPLYTYFFGMILFLVFAGCHLYFQASVLKQGDRFQKALYIVPMILFAFLALFLPSVYGSNHFQPKVWCYNIKTDADNHTDKEFIEVAGLKKNQSVIVFFSDPAAGGKFIVGTLFKKKPDDDREFNLKSSGGNKHYDKKYQAFGDTAPVLLTKLLAMPFKTIDMNAAIPDNETEDVRGDLNIRLEALDEGQIGEIENGY